MCGESSVLRLPLLYAKNVGVAGDVVGAAKVQVGVGVVEDVDELALELQIIAIVDLEVLHDAEVFMPGAGSAEHVAAVHAGDEWQPAPWMPEQIGMSLVPVYRG